MGDCADVTLLQTGFTEMGTRNRREGSYGNAIWSTPFLNLSHRNISRTRLSSVFYSVDSFLYNVANFASGNTDILFLCSVSSDDPRPIPESCSYIQPGTSSAFP